MFGAFYFAEAYYGQGYPDVPVTADTYGSVTSGDAAHASAVGADRAHAAVTATSAATSSVTGSDTLP